MNSVNNRITYVFADCDCGCKNKSYNLSKLKNGETKSCGHLRIKHNKPTKTNRIELYTDYGIIYSNNTPFYFDLNDLHYLKDKYWYTDNNGYLTHAYVINYKTHYVRFHRLIMNVEDDKFIDHINRKKNDNRKENLRVCTHKENDRNNGLYITNKTGVSGITWDKDRNKWKASITYNYKTIYIGRFDKKEEAIRARLLKELELFKEFAPQKHLISQYFSEEEQNEIRKNKSI